ncbi:Ger(x)C family spore germination protein [Paenibacillus hexagrammi]|uniref:Ger(X)C family spore germination protein n=1 Tax=Paenibacillus hexagrammi TaxID=2908839 RepID=A0ABY3SP64_9BACL|nr:Ger(x)C family spore germination protein [Paenibacillus sp. YPD9-1]UJF35034.1 Ger(x)C family spore germination protein [Paenibacillus sp. YPD9-1]
MLHKIISIALVLLGTTVLTGCWDRVEIDQRGFVTGVAIDKNQSKDKHKYKATYQLVSPSGLKQGSQGGGGSTSKAYFNLSTTENSMPALSARMASKTSRSPYFEHLKIIVISEEIARTKGYFGDLLDFFLRNSEMRRGVQIIISSGKASDILNIQPVNENMPVEYITSIVKNFRKTNFMLPQSRIGDVHEFLVRKESYAIQRIKLEDSGVTLDGAAIFDGSSNTLVGMLSGQESQGLNFIKNETKGGILESKLNERSIDFNIERMNRSIKLTSGETQPLTFDISIQVEGTLDKSVLGIDPLDEEELKKLQDNIQQLLESNCYKTITRLQKDFKKRSNGPGGFFV